ncbi:MAG: DUF6390 family protein [Patescibacteria group bacterium]|nr:DUF6390 family protein [Patescibacteria group bacterium]
MEHNGILSACRYAYPPNSLSLCGPSKQNDLSWYSAAQQHDKGTEEILQQFSTLYPYLCFIAGENKINNPFDYRVVEAYWIGNDLLKKSQRCDFLRFMDNTLGIHLPSVNEKIANGGLPHHAFHVLNVYHQTATSSIPEAIHALDACIINWGKVVNIAKPFIDVETRPLIIANETLQFGAQTIRTLKTQTENDSITQSISIGDYVSYHWGYVCERLTAFQLNNLKFYTNLALSFAYS